MDAYQIGKDIGEILERLKALEERHPHCDCCTCTCTCATCRKRRDANTGGGRGAPAGSGSGRGTKADPIPCVPYSPQADDQFCVYRVVDSEIPKAGTTDIHAQETVCIVCTEGDQSCETNEFWIVTLHGKFQLVPKDSPGYDFCRNCPSGGHTFKKFK